MFVCKRIEDYLDAQKLATSDWAKKQLLLGILNDLEDLSLYSRRDFLSYMVNDQITLVDLYLMLVMFETRNLGIDIDDTSFDNVSFIFEELLSP